MLRSISLSLAVVSAFAFIAPAPTHAGGFSDGSYGHQSRVAPKEVSAFMASSSAYRDGAFYVSQTDRAGASVSRNRSATVANGYGDSFSSVESATAFKSWKKTVQQGDAKTVNRDGTASGLSATFLKVQTADGKYYMYKGYVSAQAGLSGNIGTVSTAGIAKATGGRF